MSDKQPSARKLAAARANAAKSSGPKTPEGKARAAQNARRHGLCGKVILSTEDQADFDLMYQSYIDKWRPADEVEHDLVDTMVWAKWRERRIIALESVATELEMEDLEGRMSDWDDLSDLARTQKAYRLAQQDTPWHRYEAHAARQYDRALKQLLLLRKTNPTPAQSRAREQGAAQPQQPLLPNEANPEIEHPENSPEPLVIPIRTTGNNPPPLDDDLKAA